MAAISGEHRPRRNGRARRVGLASAVVGAMLALSVPMPARSSANNPVPFLVARKAMPAPAGFGELCGRYRWLCATSGARRSLDPSALKIADHVNRRVNHQVHQVSDRSQYGREDVWMLPSRRGGDCEDIAMLKKLRLVEAGVAPETLLVATVLDTKRAPHAVLVIRTTAGDFVLDNLRDGIRPWRQTGYSFLLMQDPKVPTRWNAIFAGGIFDRRA